MITTDFLIVCLVFAVFPMIAGYILGYRVGFKKGEAEAWLDHYFAGISRDRARRQRNGQFKAKEARTT
jgi:hypothetical protein